MWKSCFLRWRTLFQVSFNWIFLPPCPILLAHPFCQKGSRTVSLAINFQGLKVKSRAKNVWTCDVTVAYSVVLISLKSSCWFIYSPGLALKILLSAHRGMWFTKQRAIISLYWFVFQWRQCVQCAVRTNPCNMSKFASFQECFLFIFPVIRHLSKGQAGETWEASNKTILLGISKNNEHKSTFTLFHPLKVQLNTWTYLCLNYHYSFLCVNAHLINKWHASSFQASVIYIVVSVNVVVSAGLLPAPTSVGLLQNCVVWDRSRNVQFLWANEGCSNGRVHWLARL